jgi:hypothetical protein
MTDADPADDLDPLWESLPKFLEDAGEAWALREVLDAGVAGYTREDDTPEGRRRKVFTRGAFPRRKLHANRQSRHDRTSADA